MLFLSIRPAYVEMILSGEKTVELRRQRPRSVAEDWIAVYSTTPERCLRGIVQVKDVRIGSVSEMWQQVRHHAGVTLGEYESYFVGSKQAVGIVLTNPTTLASPVSLNDLRAEWPDFQPPQGFRYLDTAQVEFVVSHTRRARVAA